MLIAILTSGTKSQSFEDIRSSSNSTVNPHFHFVFVASASQGVHNFGQNFDSRPAEIELATSVVGQDNASNSVFSLNKINADRISGTYRYKCIFSALDPLQHDRYGRDGFEPIEILPAE